MKNFLAATMLSLLCSTLSAQWQKIDVPALPFLISAIDSNTLWCFNANASISRTTDGGITWSTYDIPNGQNLLLGSFISAFDSLRAWVTFRNYDSNTNYVYRTLDGGESWQQYNPTTLDNGEPAFFQKFYTIDKGIILSQDFNNHVFVFRTTNGGQTWTSQMLPINGHHSGTATYGDNNIWFYTTSGEIWRSNDGGQNWSTFQTTLLAPTNGLLMEFADSLNGLAFCEHNFNQLFRTSDGGASWQELMNAAAPDAIVSSLTKVPGLPHAWVIGYDGTAYTLDDGDTWLTEANYPDYDFWATSFLNDRQGWGIAAYTNAVFKWQDPIEAPLNGCIAFLGPLTGKLRRSCNEVWFQGSIRADISNDPEPNLRTALFYPENTLNPYQIANNIQTSCPECPFSFVPDPGQTTIGELHFEMPVFEADTTKAVFCQVSPTLCKEDTSNVFQFRTGYFATWFHPECFRIDTSNCAIELQTNVCGIDTNQYVIYYQVQDEDPVLGVHYEKNPSYQERIRFYIYVDGDFQSSDCFEVMETLYTCGMSGTSPLWESNALALRIAPNPVTDVFRIFCENLPEHQENRVLIKNAAGVSMWNQALPPGESSLFIEHHHFSNGFYIAELWSDNKLVAAEKLVVVNGF